MDTASRIEDTGEPRAQKCACVVRTEGRGKRAATAIPRLLPIRLSLGLTGPKADGRGNQAANRHSCKRNSTRHSPRKTLITHARNEAARFLGYEITTLQADTKTAKPKQVVNAEVSMEESGSECHRTF